MARGDDVLDEDDGVAGGGRSRGLEGEVVDRAHVAAADLEQRIKAAVVEQGAGSGGAAVGDVLGERSW